jgi:hypothetical protein
VLCVHLIATPAANRSPACSVLSSVSNTATAGRHTQQQGRACVGGVLLALCSVTCSGVVSLYVMVYASVLLTSQACCSLQQQASILEMLCALVLWFVLASAVLKLWL